jgi:hypothetical protein
MSKEYKYRRHGQQFSADMFEGAEKAVVIQIIEAKKKHIILMEQRDKTLNEKVKLLFDGEHRSSVLHEIAVRLSCENKHHLKMYFSDKFITSFHWYSIKAHLDSRPVSELSFTQILMEMWARFSWLNIVAAKNAAICGRFDEAVPLLCYAQERLGLLQELSRSKGTEYAALCMLEKAEHKLSQIISSLSPEEQKHVELAREGVSLPFPEATEHRSIDGSERREIVFSGAYTEALNDVKLVSVPINDSNGVTFPNEYRHKCDITHWQLKRLHHLHFSGLKIIIAKSYLLEGNIAAATEEIFTAVKLIGAADVPSFDDVERDALSGSARDKTDVQHAARRKAMDFVKVEWERYKDDYENNKSAFARDYSRRVLNEYGIKVTERNLRERWLK